MMLAGRSYFYPSIRISGYPDFRISGFPDSRISGSPGIRTSGCYLILPYLTICNLILRYFTLFHLCHLPYLMLFYLIHLPYLPYFTLFHLIRMASYCPSIILSKHHIVLPLCARHKGLDDSLADLLSLTLSHHGF